MSKTIGTALVVAVMGGCARLEIKPAADANTEGLHFYRPAPYVVISNGDKGCQINVIYLPNPDQEFVIVPHAGLGSVAFKPTLQDGWNLTAIDSTVDSKGVDLLNAIASFIPGAGKAAGGAPEAAPTCPIGLYRLSMQCLRSSAAGGPKTEASECLSPIFKETIAARERERKPAAPPAGH
ncbi:MAG TPA: hypothetical protein VE964_04495 [Myxococcales bacterium]|nr:hypothetical protein [Myxococcales bacterium]